MLEVVHGSMFGGKTTRLIERVERAIGAGERYTVFKHALDTRYDPKRIVAHNGESIPATAISDSMGIAAHGRQCDLVLIDEAQFFGYMLPTVVNYLLRCSVDVFATGITYNARGEPFASMQTMLCMADTVTVCRAPCSKCGKPAPYSQRMKPIVNGNWIGGVGDFEPRCLEHFTPWNESEAPDARA